MPRKSNAAILAMAITAFISAPSCKNSDRNISFPLEDGEFAQPVSRPLSFSKPEEIKWTIKDPGSIKQLPDKKFNFSKLPSKPFDVGEPYPLYQPLDEQPLAWENLPTTPFSLEALPTQKLKFKTRLIGTPKIIKSGFPIAKQGASRGVMQVQEVMGLKGNGRCFLQDSDGQLWIGSDQGLWRYDGENWEVYTSSQGLIDENIFAIARDKQGRIWIGTITGQVFVLDRKAGIIQQLVDKFQGENVLGILEDKDGRIWISRINGAVFIINTQNETIKQFGAKEGLFDPFVAEIFQDRQGLIWIATFDGVHIIDLKTGTNKGFKQKDGLSSKAATSILHDSHDRIWIGTHKGVTILDFKKATLSYLGSKQGLDSADEVSALLQDGEGKIWLGTEKGILYSFDEKSGLLEKFLVAEGPFNIIYNFLEDTKGQLWMGTIGVGCYFINPTQGRFGNFTKTDGLGDNGVWNILEDLNGLIWIATIRGIDVYDPASRTIKHFGKEQGLLNERIITLCQDSRGQIWASGNNSGISIIDIKKGVIKNLIVPQGLGSDNTRCFREDKGQMWIGATNGIVVTLSLDGTQVKELNNVPALTGARVNTITKDSKDQLWIGINPGGLYVIDADGKTIKHLNTTNGLISNQLNTIIENSNGNMWIGTEKGIDVADLKNNNLTSFTTREGLAHDGVWTLNERKGNIYVGTTNGLTILTPTVKDERQKQSWKAASYGSSQGLTSLDFDLNSSLVTKKGLLWAGVENEILTIINEIKSDTLTTPAYITGVNILDKPQSFSNKVITEKLVSTIDTIWKTEKDSFYANKQLPIESGYLQKNKIIWDSVQGPYSMPVNLRLPYTQNYLSFNFTGTHVSNANKARYRYILEGIDKNWSPVTEKAFSENYRDLPPGSYTFKVSSKGMNNLWSKPASFSFTITPPWWQTWWAYSLYVLIAIASIALFIRSRSQKLRSENKILEERVTRRTAQLHESLEGLKATQKQLIQSEKMASLGELTAGIAHEIQNPLNFVVNFSEVNNDLIEELKNQKSKLTHEELDQKMNDIFLNNEKISYHGRRADAIVKGMLQHSKTSSAQKELTDINALADEYLRLAYHGLRAKDKSFNATTKTSFDASVGKVHIIPQDIGRVVLNLINNAFYAVIEKHASAGSALKGYQPTVTIITEKHNARPDDPVGQGKVEIKVKDNGNGIPQKLLDKIFQPFFTTKPAGQGTGLGLSLAYDIVKAHGGELKVETKEGEGSEFSVELPITSN